MTKTDNNKTIVEWGFFTKIPSSSEGEFSHAQAKLADLNAQSFSESARTPYGTKDGRA